MESSDAGLCDSTFSPTGSNSKTICDLGTPIHDESPQLYELGEKVLAFTDNQFWEAKVMEMKYESKTWKYFVHYIGWKKTWDEWLGVESLKKYNDDNVQNFLYEENSTSTIKRKSSSVRRGNKRRKGSLDKGKDNAPLENFVNLKLPTMLKKQLLADYEHISLMGKLVKLPRSPNVEDILRMYVNYRSEEHDDKVLNGASNLLKGFEMNLRRFFNNALPEILLYKNEREQYADAIKYGSATLPSSVYGAEHLLRLFAKLPELLAGADIEAKTLMLLHTKFVSFLKFLKKNRTSFFLSTYLEETETSTNTHTNREDD